MPGLRLAKPSAHTLVASRISSRRAIPAHLAVIAQTRVPFVGSSVVAQMIAKVWLICEFSTGVVNVDYPYCATGIKVLEDGDELSIYLCGKSEQQVPFYESTVIKVTTGSTTGEQTITSIDTTKGFIATKTAEPEPSNPTPVGAIVGGVIGGVALIAVLGLAFWFLRSKKPQNNEVAAAPAPAPAPGIPPQQYQQQMSHQQDVPPPVIYDYNNNTYASYPAQGSPPPPSDPRYSQMFVDGAGSPHQSPPIEPYKTVVSPVSELPIASSPHDNSPMSELPAEMANSRNSMPR